MIRCVIRLRVMYVRAGLASFMRPCVRYEQVRVHRLGRREDVGHDGRAGSHDRERPVTLFLRSAMNR